MKSIHLHKNTSSDNVLLALLGEPAGECRQVFAGNSGVAVVFTVVIVVQIMNKRTFERVAGVAAQAHDAGFAGHGDVFAESPDL